MQKSDIDSSWGRTKRRRMVQKGKKGVAGSGEAEGLVVKERI